MLFRFKDQPLSVSLSLRTSNSSTEIVTKHAKVNGAVQNILLMDMLSVAQVNSNSFTYKG